MWIPIIAPIGLGFVSLGTDGIYRFDYLMPAELGILVFVGGVLLFWATSRAGSRQSIVSWGLILAAGGMTILMALGDVIPGSVEWAIVIAMLAVYSAAVIVMGVGGALLWRDLFSQ